MEYDFREIEQKWQDYWAKNKTFKAEENSEKPKFYSLDMFPYPSGAGLHVGHPLGYIASDIVSRYKRLKGFNVLHPMGYDAFGLPAEQYAIQTGQHPAKTTEENIKTYRRQLDQLGFSFDWDREVQTCDPNYYKWTQWIFIQLFESWYNKTTDKAEPIEQLIQHFEKNGSDGINATCDIHPAFSADEWNGWSEKEKSDMLLNYRLAFLGEAVVNWCAELGTVLANDEVKDGVSERGGYPVVQKKMKQWSLRITAYAQRLLDGLDTVDWSDSMKEMQRNWIGRSEGAHIEFKIQDLKFKIPVFTTRPDTIFGASFMVLAPEHELVQQITTEEQIEEIQNYIEQTAKRSERDRMADAKNVTGAFTGAHAINPFTNEQIPIWIADYVLAGYGTGAIMAVPSGDERDWKFAKEFGLPIPAIIEGQNVEEGADVKKDGVLTNSDFLNGMQVAKAIKVAIAKIEEMGIGEGTVNYKLRDAVFGRQRYWGEPIPIYYKDGIPNAVEAKDLPVELPKVDKYLPTEDGEPPLARAENWEYNGNPLELTTMPGWAGSSWYYLRYMDANNPDELAAKDKIEYWQNIDLYIGGAEHATGHLLYFRFWTKFLNDLGVLPFDEPAKKLINQGMIQGTSMKADVLIRATGNPETDDRPGEEYVILPKGSKQNPMRTVIFNQNFPTKYVQFQDGKYWVDNDCLSKTKEEFLQFKDYRLLKEQEAENGGLEYSGIHKNNSNLHKIEVIPEPEKMSKSKYNVETPDDICKEYGADTLRLYEMFLGPLEDHKPWNTQGIEGTYRFLRKFWRLFHSPLLGRGAGGEAVEVSDDEPTKAELKILHRTIKKVQVDIERFSFNTIVSEFMICTNELADLKCNKRAILEPLVIMLSPYAPHIAEELWEKLGHKETVTYATFPKLEEQYLVEDSFEYPVSFNGKMRFKIELSASLSKEEIEKEVLANEQSQKYLDGNTPKKVIVVPKRIVNIVI